MNDDPPGGPGGANAPYHTPDSKTTNKQRILVNFSISKNSMALGTRPLERVPNNVS